MELIGSYLQNLEDKNTLDLIQSSFLLRVWWIYIRRSSQWLSQEHRHDASIRQSLQKAPNYWPKASIDALLDDPVVYSLRRIALDSSISNEQFQAAVDFIRLNLGEKMLQEVLLSISSVIRLTCVYWVDSLQVLVRCRWTRLSQLRPTWFTSRILLKHGYIWKGIWRISTVVSFLTSRSPPRPGDLLSIHITFIPIQLQRNVLQIKFSQTLK